MSRAISKPGSAFASLPAGIVCAALVLGVTSFAQAPASARLLSTPAEIILATPDQALAYCQSGKMPAGDIAYIAGDAGLVQYGPDQNCVQQVATRITVTKAVKVDGARAKECKLAGAKPAIQLCNNGGVGEWDIDYISGKIGKTLSGPGYGCVVNHSTSSIGNAICK